MSILLGFIELEVNFFRITFVFRVVNEENIVAILTKGGTKKAEKEQHIS